MDAIDKTPAEMLATPVQFLRGVGPARGELLGRLGLHSAKDVLFCFPRDYQDLSDHREIGDLTEGELQTVCGTVVEVEQRTSHRGVVMGALIERAGEHLRAVWFNSPHVRKQLGEGHRVMLSGKPKRDGLMWVMYHPTLQPLADDEQEPTGTILPVYPLTEGLSQWQMRKIVRGAIGQYGPLIDEAFPDAFRQAHDLWPIDRALPQIHFPDDHDSLAAARRRFVYQELFVLQLALAVKRHQQRDLRRSPEFEATAKIDARIRRLFPFELTAGQEQAIAEIRGDMARRQPMNRLLQGDVGSGKTIVAVYAMLLAVAHGYQAALMAPTEVLARQHARTLDHLLGASEVSRGALVGGLPAKERAAVLERLAAGELDIVVGTQAIIQDDVRLAKLGVVVIDEQHKFGVRQRARLRYAGPDPHYLVMTATPIPRSVTMTLFGDLDVSTIPDAPPGRQKIHTYIAGDDRRERWWEFFRKKLGEGRQGFVVTPLVDESEQLEVASLQERYESLANGELEAFRLGLIHGRMKPAEKDAAMDAFRCGETQVLVCTSVIEVGVDVPNATLLTIESGERFGLAQLHQLRGRISRGRHPGYCCVFVTGQDETDAANKRLKAFERTTDGFALAEQDFALRGPGELFGTRQHGMPPLLIADLLRDRAILEEARRDAMDLITADPGLSREEYTKLRRQMLARYGKALDLGDVG